MTTSIQHEYAALRADLTYPASSALHYAKQWAEIQKLEREYDITIEAEFDDASIRGNAIASGDDALDKRIEDELIERCDRGDVWAWASVKVTVKHAGYEAHDYLGCCSYRDEQDFKRGGYYYDMIQACLADIDVQSEANQSGEH